MLKGTAKLDCCQWKAWTVLCVVLISSVLVLKIHSCIGWPEFIHCIDTLNGTVFVLALCLGVDFARWQVGGPVKPTACFKKQDPVIVLSAHQDTFRKGTFQVLEHQRG